MKGIIQSYHSDQFYQKAFICRLEDLEVRFIDFENSEDFENSVDFETSVDFIFRSFHFKISDLCFGFADFQFSKFL